jgi:hypothetical protein
MAQEPNSAASATSGLLRFSIRHLLVWTAAIAVGCVALRSASPGWVAAMLGLTLLVLATATLLAVFREGADRAHWMGFAAFGWLYLLLLVFGFASLDPNSWDSPFRPYNLATAKFSAWFYDRLYAEQLAQVQYADSGMGGYSGFGGSSMGTGGPGGGVMMGPGAMGGGMGPGSGGMPGMPGMPGSGGPPFTGPSQGDFINVAHSLWTLLLAACGGWLARWLYATGPGAKKQTVGTHVP